MEETVSEQTVESSKHTTIQAENEEVQQLRKELSDLQHKFDEWKQKAKAGVNELRQRAVELTEALRTSQQEREELEKRLKECEEEQSKKVELISDSLTQIDGAHHSELNVELFEEQLLSFFIDRANSYDEALMEKISVVVELLESNHKVVQTHLEDEFEVYKRRTAATLRLQSKNNEKLTQLLEEVQKKLVSVEDALRVNEIALHNRDDAISKLEQQLETCEVARKEMELEHMELIQSPNMNELNVMHDELERQVQSIREEYMTLEASLHIAHRNEVQRIKAEYEREIGELQHQLECVTAETTRHNLVHNNNNHVLHISKRLTDSNMQTHEEKYKTQETSSEDESHYKNDTLTFNAFNEATNSSPEQVDKELHRYNMKSKQEQLEMYLGLLNKYMAMYKKCEALQYRLNDSTLTQSESILGVDTAVRTKDNENDDANAATFGNKQQKTLSFTKNTSKEAAKITRDMLPQVVVSNNSRDVKGALTTRNSANVSNFSNATNSEDINSTKQVNSNNNEVEKSASNRVQTSSVAESSASTLANESVSMSDLAKLQSTIKLLKEELWNAKKENVKLKQSVGSVSLPQGALNAQQVQYLRSVLIKILCNLSQGDVIKHLLPVVKTVLHLPDDDMASVYKCNPS